jgi:hypothetical protein
VLFIRVSAPPITWTASLNVRFKPTFVAGRGATRAFGDALELSQVLAHNRNSRSNDPSMESSILAYEGIRSGRAQEGHFANTYGDTHCEESTDGETGKATPDPPFKQWSFQYDEV